LYEQLGSDYLTVIRDCAVSSVIRVGIDSREDLVVVGHTILVQINGALGEIIFESTRLTLLAILLGLSGDDVRGSVVIRVCAKSVWGGKGSDAISQWSDDLLGDFLLLEEGGGSRGFLGSVGLENGRLDGVLNSGRGAVNNGMSVVCERVGVSKGNLAGFAGLGLIHCLEVSLLGLNNLSGVLNGERSNSSVNGGLQVGSGANGEIVGDNFETIATSGVRDANNFALRVNVGIRSDLVTSSITESGGGLTGVGITIRSLSENILAVVLAGVVTRVDTIWDVARVRNLGSGASQEESKDEGLHDCNLN